VSLYDELRALVDALNDSNVEYAICGGVALAIHGFPRFTKDIDVLTPASSLEAIMGVAARLGFEHAALPMIFEAETPRAREVRRLTKLLPDAPLSLDLLIVGPSQVQPWASREVYEWAGRRVTVVSREGLVEMKMLAGRPQDRADLARLSGADDPEDA